MSNNVPGKKSLNVPNSPDNVPRLTSLKSWDKSSNVPNEFLNYRFSRVLLRGSTLVASALGYFLADLGSIPVIAREDGELCTRRCRFSTAIGLSSDGRVIRAIAEHSSAHRGPVDPQFQACVLLILLCAPFCFRVTAVAPSVGPRGGAGRAQRARKKNFPAFK